MVVAGQEEAEISHDVLDATIISSNFWPPIQVLPVSFLSKSWWYPLPFHAVDELLLMTQAFQLITCYIDYETVEPGA